MSELDDAFADRESGIEANLAAAHRAHSNDRERVERALAELCRAGYPFNANSVDALVLTDKHGGPYNRLVLASLMSLWAKSGRMTEVFDKPQARAIRRTRHGAILRWWKGVSAVEDAA